MAKGGERSPVSDWATLMKALEAELKQLSDLVGDDHDLFLLGDPAAMKKFAKEAPREAEALKALLDARHKELQAQALALGVRFYQEKPGIFCKRLGQYWKRWRHEPKKVLGAHYTNHGIHAAHGKNRL